MTTHTLLSTDSIHSTLMVAHRRIRSHAVRTIAGWRTAVTLVFVSGEVAGRTFSFKSAPVGSRRCAASTTSIGSTSSRPSPRSDWTRPRKRPATPSGHAAHRHPSPSLTLSMTHPTPSHSSSTHRQLPLHPPAPSVRHASVELQPLRAGAVAVRHLLPHPILPLPALLPLRLHAHPPPPPLPPPLHRHHRLCTTSTPSCCASHPPS